MIEAIKKGSIDKLWDIITAAFENGFIDDLGLK